MALTIKRRTELSASHRKYHVTMINTVKNMNCSLLVLLMGMVPPSQKNLLLSLIMRSLDKAINMHRWLLVLLVEGDLLVVLSLIVTSQSSLLRL